MANRRNIAAALLMLAAACCAMQTATAAGVTIKVTQIRASQGAGKLDIDKRLRAMNRQLKSLPYKKFEFIGNFAGNTAPGIQANIRLAQGMLLRATPSRNGAKIGLDILLFNNNALFLKTKLSVHPGKLGFLMCPAGNSAIILAVSAK